MKLQAFFCFALILVARVVGDLSISWWEGTKKLIFFTTTTKKFAAVHVALVEGSDGNGNKDGLWGPYTARQPL